MCELLGMASRVPTTVSLSLGILARRGNPELRLADGWGAAFHDGADALVVREPGAASGSPFVGSLDARPPACRFVIAHVRHATQGGVSLRNTQPFQRELGGRVHVFAHNGNLPGVAATLVSGGRFRPIGETDSEVAFCALLDRLAPLWEHGVPPLAARLDIIARLAGELRARGPANFLYTDGDALFAHADRRTQPGGAIAPPGLVMLHRDCPLERDMLPEAGVRLADAPAAGGAQAVTLFASVPLTAEPWRPLLAGSLAAARDGAIAAMMPA